MRKKYIKFHCISNIAFYVNLIYILAKILMQIKYNINMKEKYILK